MYYLYELINLMGTVEYVGQTKNTKRRLWQHTEAKFVYGIGRGKFYGRQDLTMHKVATYATRKEALQAEYDLQVYYGIPPDRKRTQGSKQVNSKLNEDQIREIKTLLAQKISGRKIAKAFNVGHTCIGNIKSGRSWSHVK